MSNRLLLSFCLVTGLALGCDEASGGDGQGSVQTDAAQTDAGAADGALDNVMPGSRDHVFLLRVLQFAREDEGRSAGFNLDDVITEQGSETGCGHEDFTSPTGDQGVDNQFSQLLPLIEQFGGMAIETYGQSAINSGNLLLMVELSGVDDPQNDEQVTMSIYRGLGAPLLGTNDLIEPWQTFDIDLETHWLRTEEARIVDGHLEMTGLDFTFPFYIFDFMFEITLKNARFSIRLDEDARHTGKLAGSISIENMLQIADNIEGGDMLPGLIRNIGTTLADMDPDEEGACQSISTTMNFETVGAFFYEDTPRPQSGD